MKIKGPSKYTEEKKAELSALMFEIEQAEEQGDYSKATRLHIKYNNIKDDYKVSIPFNINPML